MSYKCCIHTCSISKIEKLLSNFLPPKNDRHLYVAIIIRWTFFLLKICFLNGNLYKYASFAAQNNCRKKVMGFPITIIINGFSINNIIINVLFLVIN